MSNVISLTGNYDGAAVTEAAVTALVEAGTTEKRAYAVAWRDAGAGSNEAGGLSMADVFGAPVKKGGFGNLVNDGLRDVGREAEIASTGAGAVRVPKSAGMAAMIQALTERESEGIKTAVDRITTEAAEAADSLRLDDLQAAELVEEHIATLKAQVAEIQTVIKALTKDSGPYVDSVIAERETAYVKTMTRLANQADATIQRAVDFALTTGHADIEKATRDALAAIAQTPA